MITQDLLSQNEEKMLPIFARHETFHPRFGWLKKGYDKAYEDPSVFSKESAPLVLGVGKNMVKSIKYWCIAFKLIYEVKKDGKFLCEYTDFARKILGSEGWDPFLENPASLWLLHWQLFKAPCYVPAWYFTFNELNKSDFTPDDLLYALKEFKNRRFPNKKINENSLSKDLNCLLRMYVERKGHTTLKEDSLDSPFTELGILNSYSNSRRFTFNFGDKPTLPPEIILSACLEFGASFQDDARTISISRLLYDPGSPGQAFKLTESSLSDAIELVSKKRKGIYLTDTAGVIQLAYDDVPSDLSERVLDSYYNREGS